LSRWARLHDGVSTSLDFAAICREDDRAGLLFLLLLPQCDVYGIMAAHPALVKAATCPLLPWTTEDVEDCLGILESHGMILRYQAEGHDLLWVVNFGTTNRHPGSA